MNEPRKKSEFEEAVAYLRTNDRFLVLLTHLAGMRESAITELDGYETDTQLRKAAARVGVYTELLDMFAVPMGQAVPPAV